jgi:hypothetical protein
MHKDSLRHESERKSFRLVVEGSPAPSPDLAH